MCFDLITNFGLLHRTHQCFFHRRKDAKAGIVCIGRIVVGRSDLADHQVEKENHSSSVITDYSSLANINRTCSNFVYVKGDFILSCRKDGKTLSGFKSLTVLLSSRPHEIV